MTGAKDRRSGATIQTKLLGLILIPVAAVAVGLSVYFPSRQIDALRENLERKAQSYGRLVSVQVRSAVAFDDRETAREVFDAVAQDDSIEGITLFKSNGEILHAYGRVSDAVMAARSGVAQLRSFVLEDSVLVVSPVQSLEGPTGTLAVQLSTAGLAGPARRIQVTALAMGSVVLLAGLLAAFMIARSFSGRLRTLADAAAKAAEGELDRLELADGSGDEIGLLSRAFLSMLDRLRGLIDEIHRSAREEQARLEATVEERTIEVRTRNTEMRRVLERMGQGFLTIDRSGVVSSEHSAILEQWFGPVQPGTTLWEYLGGVCPQVSDELEMNWSQVIEGVLPLELSLSQMPSQLTVGDLHFAMEYYPACEQTEEFEHTLVVISDVSAEIEQQRAVADEQEMAHLCSRLIRDRSGVLEFLEESEELLYTLTAARNLETAVVMRAVHTLKGNCALFGVASAAALCHDIERCLLVDSAAYPEELITRLRGRLREIAGKLDRLLGTRDDGRIVLTREDMDRLLRAVDARMPARNLRSMLCKLRLEPTARRLSRIGEQASALAERLGKGAIKVNIEDNGLRLNATALRPFWSAFLHAVRNAVDHGLEAPDDRRARGKRPVGVLTLRTFTSDDRLWIEIEDDGQGIDWEALRVAADRKGLPAATRRDLSALLFIDGLSTKHRASHVSGRGVGLSALREACEALDGVVSVESEAGRYTRLGFSLPLALTGDVQPPRRAQPAPRSGITKPIRPQSVNSRPVLMRRVASHSGARDVS